MEKKFNQSTFNFYSMMPYFFLSLFLCFNINSVAQSNTHFVEIKYIEDEKKNHTQLPIAAIKTNQHLENDAFTLKYNFTNTQRIQVQLIAKKTIELEDIKLFIQHNKFPPAQLGPADSINYLCNGFQSWTTSQERTARDKETALSPILNAYGKNLGDYNNYYRYPRKKGMLHSWSFSYLRRDSLYTFIGSLNEHLGFTLMVHDANNQNSSIHKDCRHLRLETGDTLLVFDLLISSGNYLKIWSDYRQQLDAYQTKAKAAIGWTSWYNYYEKITEKIILDNLNNFANASIHLDIFQIDDGYQRALGDWLLCNDKFPNGMAAIADSIHHKEYKAGLWLAPFVASKKSEVFKKHPDWFVKNARGKPLKVAINVLWKGPYYVLDIYKPAVQRHLKKIIQTILYDWKYDMIKVDFLFAACLVGKSDKTRGMIMSDAMQLLRQWAGDKLILGCGVPLASAFGKVDYCRIGNDAHTGWEFGILKALGNAERPSTWSTLTNTLLRHGLNEGVFLNDPDVFMLRNENCSMNEDEKYTLLILNTLLGSVLFSSDNISLYSNHQMHLYRSIFPYIKPQIKSIKPQEQLFEIELKVQNRNYIMWSNLSNKNKDISLPKGTFYDSKSKKCYSNEDKILLEKHQSMLFYCVNQNNSIDLLGGNNHLISGVEIRAWEQTSENSIAFSCRENAQIDQPIYFYVRDTSKKYIYVNQKKVDVNNKIASFKPENLR